MIFNGSIGFSFQLNDFRVLTHTSLAKAQCNDGAPIDSRSVPCYF